MGDYAKYHCFGFNPEKVSCGVESYGTQVVEEPKRKKLPAGAEAIVLKWEELDEEATKVLHAHTNSSRYYALRGQMDKLEDVLLSVFGVNVLELYNTPKEEVIAETTLVLNLLDIQDPTPTERQLDWLHKVHGWGIIPTKVYDKAILSFDKAQKCISQYYTLAHNYYMEHYYVAFPSRSKSSGPNDGQRKYYADGICKYSEFHGRYVDEADYDRTVRQYGSYANKDRIESLEREIEERNYYDECQRYGY